MTGSDLMTGLFMGLCIFSACLVSMELAGFMAERSPWTHELSAFTGAGVGMFVMNRLHNKEEDIAEFFRDFSKT